MKTDADFYLSIHVETTGLNSNIDQNVNEGHSIVAIGVSVCDKDFNKVDDKIIFIDSGLNNEEIVPEFNGITKEFLSEEGISEEDAVIEFANFILEYFSPNDNIVCLGQNVQYFCIPFLKELLYKYEVYINFACNALDVFSLTTPTLGELSLKEVVEVFGDVDNLPPFYQQEEYACLLKTYAFIEVFRRINKQWNRMIKKT